jgi:hypothetical protein
MRNLPAIPGNIRAPHPVFILLSCIWPLEKSGGFQLTRFFGVLEITLIRVYLPGVS